MALRGRPVRLCAASIASGVGAGLPGGGTVQVPKQPGERVKTDWRDAIKLALLLRSGTLSVVWILDSEQEVMRDLTRPRGDMKVQEREAKQQLNAFLLRNEHPWPANKKHWSSIHFYWLDHCGLNNPTSRWFFRNTSMRSRRRHSGSPTSTS